jgi:hypothetical protein
VCSTETINAIDKVTCTDFEIPCPSGEKFYFMLTTPGEVYTQGMKDPATGKIIKAPGGVVECDTILADYRANGDKPNIYIWNDHFENP